MSSYDDLDGFKSWLSNIYNEGEPFSVIYELDPPSGAANPPITTI